MITHNKDYRLPENRKEYFNKLYAVNLNHGIMPGLVYLYLPALADKYGWDHEQKLWFAFLNGMTQNPITSLKLFEQLPEVPPAGAALTKFTDWFNASWDSLQYDTDRRYQKKDTITAIKSYADIVSKYDNQLYMIKYLNYPDLWKLVRDNYSSFGRLSAFSYLEYVYLNGYGVDCDNLLFEDKSGSKSHRNGMMFLQGADQYVWDKRSGNDFDGNYPDFPKICTWLNETSEWHIEDFKKANPMVPNAGNFTFESNLCTFKNHFFGRRYPGVYSDMAWARIEWAEERGADVSVFRDIREASLPDWLRVEMSGEKMTSSYINKKAAQFKDTGVPFRGEYFL